MALTRGRGEAVSRSWANVLNGDSVFCVTARFEAPESGRAVPESVGVGAKPEASADGVTAAARYGGTAADGLLARGCELSGPDDAGTGDFTAGSVLGTVATGRSGLRSC